MAGDTIEEQDVEEHSTMQESIVIDRNHPLYLHPSDGPNSLSLGFQLIEMENYTIWSQAMEVSLLTRNKLGFVDGSIARDTFGTRFNHLWDRCNAIVKSWLMHNVSRDLLSGVLFRLSARAIWEDLRERFDKVNSSRMYYLHKEIFTLTQGISSLSAYYSKFKDLWDEYDSIIPAPPCDCEKSKKYLAHLQYQRLWQFLMGLNDGYSQARSQILMKNKAPSVNQAYAMILQDESQRIVGGSHTVPIESMEPTTLFTSRNNTQKQRRNYNVECDFCHIKGHT
ncbi:uncharacterized protein LOC142165758 [Nicotiana tabacum]|uniref:Uncharacterized protein LOC142165758 n=1 Tax=Nicotiana tabacum TaxID=4097 RepID=A0AC58S5G8_TOBAC